MSYTIVKAKIKGTCLQNSPHSLCAPVDTFNEGINQNVTVIYNTDCVIDRGHLGINSMNVAVDYIVQPGSAFLKNTGYKICETGQEMSNSFEDVDRLLSFCNNNPYNKEISVCITNVIDNSVLKGRGQSISLNLDNSCIEKYNLICNGDLQTSAETTDSTIEEATTNAALTTQESTTSSTSTGLFNKISSTISNATKVIIDVVTDEVTRMKGELVDTLVMNNTGGFNNSSVNDSFLNFANSTNGTVSVNDTNVYGADNLADNELMQNLLYILGPITAAVGVYGALQATYSKNLWGFKTFLVDNVPCVDYALSATERRLKVIGLDCITSGYDISGEDRNTKDGGDSETF